MQKLALGLAMATLLAGCATAPKVALTTPTGLAMRGKTIVQTHRATPNFSVLKPLYAPLGPLGGMLTIATGNGIAKTYQLADPAKAISAALLKEIATARSMNVLEPAMPVDSSDPARISAIARGQVNYVLDVETTFWHMSYFSTDWTRYRAMHVANARLIEAATGKIVAQSACKYMPDSKANALTYDEMIGTYALGLKKAMQTATDECITNLKSSLLSL